MRRTEAYSSITPLIEDFNTALGRKRLRTGHDALGAVHHAPPAGPFHVLDRRGRKQRGRGKRHLGFVRFKLSLLFSYGNRTGRQDREKYNALDDTQ